MRRFWQDFSRQAAMQGVLVAIVGYASSVAIVVQGLKAVGATSEQIASGLFVLGLGKGIVAIGLSLYARMPISIAWTTPGLALLAVTPAVQGGFGAAVGAFIVVGVLIMLTALWPPLARLINAIPKAIANAMLAGIIFKLCLAPFIALKESPAIAAVILLTWVVMLKVNRLYAVPAAVVVAVTALALTGQTGGNAALVLPPLSLVQPVFTLEAMISIAIPVFIVTMASQNITGLAVLATFDFKPKPRDGLLATGFVSAVTAPFGAPAINFAAITAALCASPEAHPDPARRYVAAVVGGVGYILLALLAGVVTALVVYSSPLLIEAVAGLALIGSFASATANALQVEEDRIPAMATLLVTASGLALFNIGPAFWGLVIGWGLYLFFRWQPR
ncbi:MAG: benzoate/H(+) symporter BenE family transporter [Methylocystis sp.]|nr:benzoate/H(+) symporter BenE family transporter [Methylocystis sp.]MCA3584781.1 benzoate/H(+) symporter BenE family transporter [Methylocystis sp.]MCA3589262.1 benzoate/H(+) symporter BenE family transporter [Methylocystis sp.]MCA3593218.1 benzoate/H(+) symporter BenE family transporter [Methylocystis sp.]